jgi:hypothetical protein
MSGGYFDHRQWNISDIASEIEEVIKRNDSTDTNAYGDPISYNLSEETIAEFKNAVVILNKAAIYAQRIDWLLSGDDGEETFHKRLKEDLLKITG